ncbi:MAG TPA: hypothetical protein DEB39_10100 [Planctomycetaceae bacterium]|nr:hypothetical protein [Planctomycetaceae bacterium]
MTCVVDGSQPTCFQAVKKNKIFSRFPPCDKTTLGYIYAYLRRKADWVVTNSVAKQTVLRSTKTGFFSEGC